MAGRRISAKLMKRLPDTQAPLSWVSKVLPDCTVSKTVQQGTHCKVVLGMQAEKRQGTLEQVLAKHMLRRTKAIIWDQLPAKTDSVVFCRLAPMQERAYR